MGRGAGGRKARSGHRRGGLAEPGGARACPLALGRRRTAQGRRPRSGLGGAAGRVLGPSPIVCGRGRRAWTGRRFGGRDPGRCPGPRDIWREMMGRAGEAGRGRTDAAFGVGAGAGGGGGGLVTGECGRRSWPGRWFGGERPGRPPRTPRCLERDDGAGAAAWSRARGALGPGGGSGERPGALPRTPGYLERDDGAGGPDAPPTDGRRTRACGGCGRVRAAWPPARARRPWTGRRFGSGEDWDRREQRGPAAVLRARR
jgi:hypothetical protein